MVLCEMGVISGRLKKNKKPGHLLQNVPKNVLKYISIVMTVAMPSLNSTEVFVWFFLLWISHQKHNFNNFQWVDCIFSCCGT